MQAEKNHSVEPAMHCATALREALVALGGSFAPPVLSEGLTYMSSRLRAGTAGISGTVAGLLIQLFNLVLGDHAAYEQVNATDSESAHDGGDKELCPGSDNPTVTAELRRGLADLEVALTLLATIEEHEAAAVLHYVIGTQLSVVRPISQGTIDKSLQHLREALALHSSHTELWAAIKTQLARVLLKHRRAVGGAEYRLAREARKHIYDAHAVFTRDSHPLQWAMGHVVLAKTFSSGHDRQSDDDIQAAIDHYRLAAPVLADCGENEEQRLVKMLIGVLESIREQRHIQADNAHERVE